MAGLSELAAGGVTCLESSEGLSKYISFLDQNRKLVLPDIYIVVGIRSLTGQELMGQKLRAPPTMHARENEMNALPARRD